MIFRKSEQQKGFSFILFEQTNFYFDLKLLCIMMHKLSI